MRLYNLSGSKIREIAESKFKRERDLQKIVEENLENIFNYKLISSEFTLHNLRIDTLAFNPENNSFVIIEYKRDRSFSVIDQGYAYLALLLNNQADFILEYNEKNKIHLKRSDIDWSQSVVIFIADSFTRHQLGAINFKDLPIELWEVKRFENNILSFNELKKEGSIESIKLITKNPAIEKVSAEIQTYSVEDHFKEGWDESKEIYSELRERIFKVFPDIEETPVKSHISFKLENKTIFFINIYKSGISINFNRSKISDFDDPKNYLKYLKDSYKYYNQHITYYFMKHGENVDLNYAEFLLRQIYDRFQ
mgnify:FL=1